jgi:hypothetical protein
MRSPEEELGEREGEEEPWNKEDNMEQTWIQTVTLS